MTEQLDFIHTLENNPQSQSILDNNRKRFNGQAKKVLDYLMKTNLIDCDKAKELFGVRHLPRRILDIEEATGVKPSRKYSKSGLATHYLTPEQIKEIEKKYNV